jgi:hypothetical protein
MVNPNPASKDIDIQTKKGLELLKTKAKYYGHYAEQLKVLELIQEIESLRCDPSDAAYEASKKLGW